MDSGRSEGYSVPILMDVPNGPGTLAGVEEWLIWFRWSTTYTTCVWWKPRSIPLPRPRGDKKPKHEPRLTWLFVHLNLRQIPEGVGSSECAAERHRKPGGKENPDPLR